MRDTAETVVLAGGCFWIMQQLLRHRDGVISTRVGWTGGQNDNPTEENNSGHAEAVEVVFDPERLSCRSLLELFFQVHRPDLSEDLVGSSYRSEIFLHNRQSAQGGRGDNPRRRRVGPLAREVVTKISEAGPFWEAEAEDQDRFQRYPNGCPSPFPRLGAEAAGNKTAA